MDARDSDRYKALTRRALVVGGLKISLFAVLAGRMYFLQVIDGEQYQMLAEKNRINIRLLAPPRGVIRDRFGVELATNRQNLRVVLIPEQADDVTETLDGIAKLVPLTDFNRTRLLREIKRTKGYIPVSVAENLSWEQFSSVNLNMPDLSGVQPDIGETRDYPFGSMLAHCIGYVAQVPEGYPDNDPLLQLPGFRIGKSGLEKTYDAELRGKAGSSQVEVDAFGRSIRELSRTEGDLGAEIVTTLDMELQRYAVERLEGESAALVTLDVQTGEILAFVSTPSFDPNIFNVGATPAQYAAYLQDDHHPLINKVIQGQYPPGSTFKLCVSLAGLETGTLDPNFRVSCNGTFHFGNSEWHCWTYPTKPPHGSVDLHGAIMHSCDIYFYEAAMRIGVERIAAMAHRLGLGDPVDIGLADEKSGVIPTKAWMQAVRHQVMTPGMTLNIGIGQGEVLVTPLQLATMVGRIANGQKAIKPYLVRSVGGVPVARPEPPDLGISQNSINIVQAGAYSVVNDPGGTAYNPAIGVKVRFDIGGVKMCGKSGTAEVHHRASGDRRKPEEMPWNLRSHALFVGWTPTDVPRYATVLVLEHGIAGGRYAGPIVSDVLQQVLLRDPAHVAAYVPQKPDGDQG